MKKVLVPVFCWIIVCCGCSKDKGDKFVTGTVQEAGGCYADGWIVSIDKPDFKKQAFICEPPQLSTGLPFFDCTNSVIIKLPSAFAVSGKKVRFTVKDIDLSCYSSTYPPRHILVENLTEQ